MKINAFNDTRPVLSSGETKSFIDPRFPDSPFELTLRGLDEAELAMAYEEGDAMHLFYFGDLETKPRGSFPNIDNKTVKFSRGYSRVVMQLCHMQTATSEEEAYTFQQMMAVAITRPKAFSEAVTWAQGLCQGLDSKNA